MMMACFLICLYYIGIIMVACTVQYECPSYGLKGPHDDYLMGRFFKGEKQMKGNLSEATSNAAGNTCPIVVCKNTKTVSCTFMHLEKIPTNQPSCIEELILSDNLIKVIGNRSMVKYVNLRALDLRHNNISFLLPESFYGLSNLRYLNLLYNDLAYVEHAFPVGVFKPLKNLNILIISKNNPNITRPNLKYPAEALAPLTSLRHLFMDGLTNPAFSQSFQNLTSLAVLSVSGYVYGDCHIQSLNNSTFIYLSQLRCLYMTSCFITSVERETFTPLKNLVKLDLTHNEDLGIQNLPNVSYGFRKTSTLKSLGIHLIVPRDSLSLCLSNESLDVFPSSIEHLDAQENSLEAVGNGVVERLPKALKTLDLSGNNFVFGTSLTVLHKMKELRTLKLNGRSFVYQLPQLFPYTFETSLSSSDIISNSNKCLHSYRRKIPVVLNLPPKLKTLEMIGAGLIYRLTNLTVDRNNSLTKLNLTGNRFPSLEGPFNGLHSLKHLDLSYCFVERIKNAFFTSLPTLRTLNLTGNVLGLFFSSPESGSIFSHLHNLHDLDLSFNFIEKLRRDVFYGLRSLKFLHLKGNLIIKFDTDISHMSDLRFLNVSHTRIAMLDADMRHLIDNLTTKTHFQIDMSFTPIFCDCGNLVFLKWMVSSKAFDQHFENYQCAHSNLEHQTVNDEYANTLYMLGRKCTSSLYLVLVVCMSVTLVFVIVGVSICYRFRWNLRYLYHVAYLHYKKETRSKCQEFEFDVFICYANEDQDFVLDVLQPELQHRGLEMLVHGRDFVAGEYVTSNIVGAVCRSRKTLVVLTHDMLKSSWCNFEVQMANMEAVHTGRKVLIFLIRGSLPESDRNLDVFYNIKINTYIEFPSYGEVSENKIKAIWEKLARDIRS